MNKINLSLTSIDRYVESYVSSIPKGYTFTVADMFEWNGLTYRKLSRSSQLIGSFKLKTLDPDYILYIGNLYDKTKIYEKL